MLNLEPQPLKSAEPLVQRALEPLLHLHHRSEKQSSPTRYHPSRVQELILPGNGGSPERLLEWRTTEMSWEDRSARLFLLRDISERRRAEIERHRHLYFSPINGLPNRAFLHERLVDCFTRQQDEAQIALILLDLDRFSNINQSLGYVTGDQVLLAAAQVLQTVVRPSDLLFSLGEDEYALLIYDENKISELPATLGEQLRQRISQPLQVEEHTFFLTASVGVVLRQPYHHQAEELIRDAYTALNEAKARRGNRCFFFEPSMHEQALRRQQLEHELRVALQKEQLTLFYQPVLSLREPGKVGFEALMRWRHPERGMVPPSEFIPLAEDSGLIIPLGLMALRVACQQLRHWMDSFGEDSVHRISVNLSVAQLRRPEFLGEVQQVLLETRVPPDRLWLEVTESLVIDDPEAAIRCLESLHGLGLRLILDDFGTGYSSLSYLQQLPLSGLKIDRSFVQRLGDSAKELDIVRMITALAHRLGLVVVAEGVETQEQLVLLESVACDFVQGYLHGKPQHPTELESRWFKKPLNVTLP
ncbi:MAG: putative bifunctional diguanylate cyclase/phosphodiesterase [Myxococcota bacterium]